MKMMNKKFIAFSLLFCALFISCEDLTEVNENPNGVQPRICESESCIANGSYRSSQGVC